MAVIVCRGCGQRHDALARCPVGMTTATAPVGEAIVVLPKALMMSEVARQKERPKVDEVSTLSKPTRLAKAREVLEGDCSNPACPYRGEVMKMRERNRKAVAKFRAKSGKVGT